jgi:hypothetical protein
MLNLIRNRQFLNQVLCLNESEQQNPMATIDDLFSDYSLAEIRKWSWDMLQAYNTTDNPLFDKAVQRADALTFHDRMIQFVEAAFILRTVHSACTMKVVP